MSHKSILEGLSASRINEANSNIITVSASILDDFILGALTDLDKKARTYATEFGIEGKEYYDSSKVILICNVDTILGNIAVKVRNPAVPVDILKHTILAYSKPIILSLYDYSEGPAVQFTIKLSDLLKYKKVDGEDKVYALDLKKMKRT
jgi:hypothetical protein